MTTPGSKIEDEDAALLARSLELSGYVLLTCDAALDVLATRGACAPLVLNGALLPALVDAVQAMLTTGKRSSPYALRGCPDFRLVQVDVESDGRRLIWLRRSATSRVAFGKLLRERYGFKLRSQQLLQLLVQGLGNRAIAAELGLREATVKTYLHEVYGTLGVRSRTEALAELHRALDLEA
ncbi:MAG TPA: LuxR C-terminal-related transcriptional regulator [Polyangiaceae bacterium]|nr:LuxR C-terminal-related transcriptional regulator [Polyangiaceae bacterium]